MYWPRSPISDPRCKVAAGGYLLPSNCRETREFRSPSRSGMQLYSVPTETLWILAIAGQLPDPGTLAQVLGQDCGRPDEHTSNHDRCRSPTSCRRAQPRQRPAPSTVRRGSHPPASRRTRPPRRPASVPARRRRLREDTEELVVGTHPGAAEVTVQVSAGNVTLNGALRPIRTRQQSSQKPADAQPPRPRRYRPSAVPAIGGTGRSGRRLATSASINWIAVTDATTTTLTAPASPSP